MVAHGKLCRAAFYFALTTIATVGYGDITAGTTIERLIAIAFMVRLLSLLRPWMRLQKLQCEAINHFTLIPAVPAQFVGLGYFGFLLSVLQQVRAGTLAEIWQSCNLNPSQPNPQLGRAIDGCVRSQLIQTSGAEARRAALFREQIMTLEAWMKTEALPHPLRHKIRCYFSGASKCTLLQTLIMPDNVCDAASSWNCCPDKDAHLLCRYSCAARGG